MLAYLNVKGFAIIDEIKAEFGEGFNVITGETGAGKSIIINALSTLMNAKVSSDIVRSSASQAEVTGYFVNGQEECILKRVVSSAGRSRAFFNDEPITIGRLESLGSGLISIYGQNEFQHLLDKDNYRGVIDTLLKLTQEQEALAAGVDLLRSVASDLDHRTKEAQGRDREMELLEFQIEEIRNTALQDGEEEAIKERLKVLKNSERISGALKEIGESFQGGDNSAQGMCKRSMAILRPFASIESVEGLRKAIEVLSFDMEEVILQMREVEKGLLFDPEELESLEERITEIFKLKEKYGKSYEEIMHYAQSAQDRLEYLRTLSTDISSLETRKKNLENDIRIRADQLSAKRKKGSLEVEKAIMGELQFLSMKGLKFQVLITDKGFVDRDGRDDIEFVISTNPGEPLKPLRRVASGGELSRIMLAIKKVIGGETEKTLVFDEVDAGIGGKVADVVGKRLQELARSHQILCITHLPQIAAYGDHHFLVEKEFKAGQTRTVIRELSGDERVHEMARMMAGETITDKTIERAKEMLCNA